MAAAGPRAAVLWTGGKDSALALHLARATHDVTGLVTFVPDPPRPFLAHPLECMRAQADALGLPHRTIPVAEPLAPAYERAIAELATEGVEVLVTGDIDRVAGHDNWIVERSAGLVDVHRPLWQADRPAVLRQLLDVGLRAVCTLARDDAFETSPVGRELDADLVETLVARHGRDGFDACGENGEYHTCVIDGPGFAHALAFERPRVVQGDGHRHLAFASIARAR